MSKQVEYATPKPPSLDQQLEAELAGGDMPINLEGIRQEQDQEIKQKQANMLKKNEELMAARGLGEVQAGLREGAVDLIDMAAGVHTGVRGIVRNTYNGVVGVVDWLENYAAEKGVGTGDLLSEANKWEDEKGKMVESEMGQPGKVANALTRVAAPLAAGWAAAGPLAGVAVDTAYAFLADAPDDPNLVESLKGTFADEIPGFYTALQVVGKKPDDSEITKRIKNAATALGFSATLTGGVAAYSRFKAGKQVLTKPETMTAVQRASTTLATEPIVPKPVVPDVPPAPKIDPALVEAEAKALQETFNPPGQMAFTEPRALDNIVAPDGTIKVAGKEPFKGITQDLMPAPRTFQTPNGSYEIKAEVGRFTDTGKSANDFDTLDEAVRVAAFDENGTQVAYMTLGTEDGKFVPKMLVVYDDLQGQGISTEMVKYTKETLGEVQPSKFMTEKGEAFTVKTLAREQAEKLAPYKRVAEQNLSEEQRLAKMESENYSSPDTPEEAALFEQQWKKLEYDQPAVTQTVDGEPALRLQNDSWLDSLYNMSKADPQGVLRTPITDAQLLEGARIAKNDPARVQRVISFKADDILNDEDTLVAKFLMHNTEAEYQKFLAEFPENPGVDDLLLLNRKTEGYIRMGDILQGNASNKGAALRAEQVAAATFGTSAKNGLALMGAQGRAALSKELLRKYGGQEMSEGVARGLKIIANIPDNQFRNRMGEVLRKSKFERLDDAITKVAINGMTALSTKGAAIANNITATKLVVDKYVTAMLPGTKTTLEDANALASGMANSIKDGIKVGWSAATDPDAASFATKLDLVAGAAKLTTQEDLAIKSAFLPWSERGIQLAEKSAEALSLKGAPTKALIGLDAAYNHIVTQGLLQAEASRMARELGVLPHELPEFLENFMKNPPTDIADKVDVIARTTTLSNDPTGFMAKGLELAEGLQGMVPTGRVVFPFLRTTANAMVYFADNSPFFALSPNFMKAVQVAKNGGGGELLEAALVKATTGSAAIATLMYLANQGNLTGGYVENKDNYKANKGKSAPLTSVKVNGTWVQMDNLGYISSLIDIASFLNKASSYMEDEEYAEVAAGLLAVTAEGVAPDNLTDNIAGLVNMIEGKPGAQKWMAELPTRYIPMGSVMGLVRKSTDKFERDTKLEGFLDMMKAKFMNRIPGLSDNLEASRNFFGEAITVAPGVMATAVSLFTPGDGDPGEGLSLKQVMDNITLYQKLHEDDPIKPTELAFRPPRNTVPNIMADEDQSGIKGTGLQYELTPREYAAYQKLAGGIDPTSGKPYTTSLKDRFKATFEKYGLYDTEYSKITPQQYEAATSELKVHVTELRAMAAQRIRQFGSVQYNMNLQARKALEFKQKQGIK